MLYATKPGPNGPQLRAIPSEKELIEGEVAYSGPLSFQADGISLDMAFDEKLGLRAKTENERLRDLKAAKCETIKAAAEAALRAGCPTSFGFNMDFDRESISSLTSYHALASEVGVSDVIVCDFDNVQHTVNFEEFKKLLVEIGSQHQAVWHKKWQLREEIQKAEKAADLKSITW